MDKRAIGIFDTDGGGIAVARALERLMPQERVIALCDTARAPYGERAKEDIARDLLRGLRFLLTQDVKLLLCACGTASAILPDLNAKELTAPVIGLLQPCAQEGCATSANGRIGVIGAPGAVRSGAYGRAVRNIRADARVIGAATPLLDPLTEGCLGPDSPELRATVARYLEPLAREDIDTLILANAGYVPLFAAISEAADYNVTVIDPALTAARCVQSRLLQDGLQSDEPAAPAVWYVTGEPERFIREAARYGGTCPEPKTIALD